MEHTAAPLEVTNEKNVEATKENPLNLDDDKEDDKDSKELNSVQKLFGECNTPGINPARSLGAAVIYNQDKAWDDH
ncbi:hypothetical protein ACET3Z_012052 [Daucus carota]